MLNPKHAKPEIIELNDAELEAVVGGNWLGDFFGAIGGAIGKGGRPDCLGLHGGADDRCPAAGCPLRGE